MLKSSLKKTFALFIILTFVSSCSLIMEPMPKSWRHGFKPRPMTGVRNFPPTDTEYGKGFKDGCHSSFDVVTKGILADYNEKRFDFKRMQKSADYGTGWWDGMEQCTYIMDWDVV